MGNIANEVLLERPDYSKHNLSNETKTTGNLGQLIPIMCMEVVPGDNVDLNAEFLTKFQPMVTPAFQNFNAYVHYFYMPYQAMWNNWQYFIAQIPEPGASVPPLHPLIEFAELSDIEHGQSGVSPYHNLAPYFGINAFPAGLSPVVNAFPFIMYNHIYNEYYRHEKIHEDLKQYLLLPDGMQTWDATQISKLNKIRYRTYKDDYFTAALQSPQLGEEATLQLIGLEDMEVLRDYPSSTSAQSTFNVVNVTGGASTTARIYNVQDADIPTDHLYVQTSNLDARFSMNDFIELQRMQEFLVRSNLAGTRYNEFVKSHFGIQIPDLRLHRPDYICGVKAPVIISELLNTADGQGTQTGQGSAYSEGGRGNYKVLDYGLIMGIYSCIPTQSYTQASQKLMWKNSALDYFLPVFDQMGEQPIYNKEINLSHLDPDGTFGYIPRYGEYRLPFNSITGEFATNLTTWHLGQILPEDVALDSQFFDIENPDRVFAVTAAEANSILIQVYNQVYISRPMSKHSIPTLSNVKQY